MTPTHPFILQPWLFVLWSLAGWASLLMDRDAKIFLEHYHNDRPHQGLDNELIVPFERPPPSEGKIEVDKRLGGLLKSYRRAA